MTPIQQQYYENRMIAERARMRNKSYISPV